MLFSWLLMFDWFLGKLVCFIWLLDGIVVCGVCLFVFAMNCVFACLRVVCLVLLVD